MRLRLSADGVYQETTLNQVCTPEVGCPEDRAAYPNLPNTITVVEGVTVTKDRRQENERKSLGQRMPRRRNRSRSVSAASALLTHNTLEVDKFSASVQLMLQMSAIAAYFDFWSTKPYLGALWRKPQSAGEGRHRRN